MTKSKLLFLLVLASSLVHAQMLTPAVVSPGGNYATGGGYSLSQNFGELAVQTLTAGTSILTQGFEQPYPEQYVGITDNDNAGMSITLYPNPASDMVSLTILSDRSMDYLVRITDLPGKQISSCIYGSSVIGMVHQFDVSGLASGLYLFTVSSADGKFTKTIRFNKN
jgi:hypothetical protein